MIPARLLPHTITIERLVESDERENYSEVATGVKAAIQPLNTDVSGENTAEQGMAHDRDLACWVNPGTDIEIGDRITDQDSNQYQVFGLKRYNYGRGDHIEAKVSRELGK